ncbi:hypothetical protein [Streptomyces stelliscabiei]|uniref:hypothetical protein n=1 Tax=Streptomyces stelliscabiei TaxID=146820 RepID=UPI0029B9D88E|nr:hypothetical protein [Streptomyces stelliscabiei]MDX3435658.1 hypothetical protein [Streptomyces stelliscabiei]MDX3622043.1 hypothetical protein [Streptomyces stelliscabiei]
MGKPRTPRKATTKTATAKKVNKHEEETLPAVPKRRRHWLPDPGTRWGAVFYAVAGSAMFEVGYFVLRHVHITIG